MQTMKKWILLQLMCLFMKLNILIEFMMQIKIFKRKSKMLLITDDCESESENKCECKSKLQYILINEF